MEPVIIGIAGEAVLFAVVIHLKSAFLPVMDDSSPLLDTALGRSKFRIHLFRFRKWAWKKHRRSDAFIYLICMKLRKFCKTDYL